MTIAVESSTEMGQGILQGEGIKLKIPSSKKKKKKKRRPSIPLFFGFYKVSEEKTFKLCRLTMLPLVLYWLALSQVKQVNCILSQNYSQDLQILYKTKENSQCYQARGPIL